MAENEYIEELKKFLKKEVIVTAVDGTIFKGICKALDYNHHNCIIMTETEKIIIKNIRNISRIRNGGNKNE